MVDRTMRLNIPMRDPADVVPHLAKGQAHWKPGYSAHALATTWFAANGLPERVRTLLAGSPQFAGAELVDAILERCTDLQDGARGPSQTDLLAIVGVGSDLAVLAVEGKVRESFGPRVGEWRDGSPAKVRRLGLLLDAFGVATADADGLRYQLFHRAAAAVFEAQRYRARRAMLMVHSFSDRRDGWTDFAAFAAALGIGDCAEPGRVSSPRAVRGIDLHLAWLADTMPPAA